MDERDVLTLEESARFLRVSVNTMRKLLQENPGLGGKVGQQWRVRRQALEEHLRGGAARPGGPK